MTVLQPWLEALPIRMQSTLLLSLRGPDTHRCPEIKKVQRWMRGLAFKPGNPDNVKEFMLSGKDVPKGVVEKGDLARELEFCSQHFYSHLMHGLEVIAFGYPKNPDKETDECPHQIAFVLYRDMCHLFHLPIEYRDDFNRRLKQVIWSDKCPQPETMEQALRLIK